MTTGPKKTLAAVIGGNLRRLRLEHWGDSQEDFAHYFRQMVPLPWTRDTVASIEMGRRGVSIEELLLVCWACDLEVGWFFRGDDDIDLLGDAEPPDWDLWDFGLDLAYIRAMLKGGETLASSKEASRLEFEKHLEGMDERPVGLNYRGRKMARSADRVVELASEQAGVSTKVAEGAAAKLWATPPGTSSSNASRLGMCPMRRRAGSSMPYAGTSPASCSAS